MPKLYFGIVIYQNKPSDMLRLLKSIDLAAYIAELPYQVLFLDNGMSFDFSQIDEITKFEVVPTIGNVGFGAGHNRLIKAAAEHDSGAIYIGANPDGFFQPSSLKCAKRWFSIAEPNDLFEFRQIPIEHPKVYDFRTGATNWCSGSCFAAKIGDLLDVGGFDENFFLYCEDVDLSWRMHIAGGTCRIMYDSEFFHDLSRDRNSFIVRTEMLKSGRYLAWKYSNHSFRQIIEERMVECALADSRQTLPQLSKDDIAFEEDVHNHIVEFRRLFSFSATRWNV